MKKLTVAICFASLTQIAIAQESDKKVNIRLGAHGGGFGLGPAVDVVVGENITLGGMMESIRVTDGTTTASSRALGAGLRYYFEGALKSGGYFNPYLMLGKVEVANHSASAEVQASALGAMVGYQWIRNFNFDLGIGYKVVNLGDIVENGSVSTQRLDNSSFSGLSLGISLGYAF